MIQNTLVLLLYIVNSALFRMYVFLLCLCPAATSSNPLTIVSFFYIFFFRISLYLFALNI